MSIRYSLILRESGFLVKRLELTGTLICAWTICAAASVIEGRLAEFIGLTDSKYQWAVDEHNDRQLVRVLYFDHTFESRETIALCFCPPFVHVNL